MVIDNETLTAALASEEPNAPARPTGLGKPGDGNRRYIPPEEARQRRKIMSTLLEQGASFDTIVEILSAATPNKERGIPGFGMTVNQIRNLRREVYAQWQEEDAEAKPHYKAAAMRRINRQITKAGAAGAHGAVAQLENTLSKIQGTGEAIEVNVGVGFRVTRSLIEVLGEEAEKDPAKLREMIDEQRRIEQRRALAADAIDADFEEVDPDEDDDAV